MNKKKSRNESLFQKKGFYVALYSCVAALLIAAVAISYSSINEAGKANQEAVAMADLEAPATPLESQAQADRFGDSASVVETDLNDFLQSRAVNASDAAKAEDEEIPQKSFVEPEAKPNPFANVESAPTMSQTTTPISQNQANSQSAASQGLVKVEPADSAVKAEDSAISEEKPPETSQVANIQTPDNSQVLADPVFNAYDGEKDMEWPVFGSIVMDYSDDKLIYDLTLNQYRTNDNICISAAPGETVKAAADGVVKSIEKNSRELGNSVVIEHGNGWRTTYSQLQDDFSVSVGDVVLAGQDIGKVGSPSIYSVLLGEHLSFKVTRDSEPINPNMILVQR